MEITDEYINKLKAAKGGTTDSSILPVIKDAVAVFSDVIPTIQDGLDAYRSRAAIPGGTPPKYDNAGDVRRIIDKLRLYKSMRQQNESEEYGITSLVNFIERCDAMLEDGVSEQERKDFCYEVSAVYGREIPGFDDYLWSDIYGSPEPEKHIPLIKSKLLGRKDRIIQNAKQEAAQVVNNLNAQQNANPIIAQTHNTTIGISFNQIIKSIDEDDMSEEEKRELKALLADAEAAKGKNLKLREIGKKIADFAFNKAVSSLPALLNYMAGLFQ